MWMKADFLKGRDVFRLSARVGKRTVCAITMNRNRILAGALLLLAVTLVVRTFMPSRGPAEPAVAGDGTPVSARAAPAERAGVRQAAGGAARAVRAQAGGAAAEASPEERAGHASAEKVAGKASEGESAEEVTAARERAVASWDSLVDRLAEREGPPDEEASRRVKEAFDALDPADQMDGIRRSLNLFQDEQFPVLYGILFDKAENAEVLDAIFSDALNRPEEIKNPLMKELVKDKEHPCFFESARILDVIGELVPASGGAATAP